MKIFKSKGGLPEVKATKIKFEVGTVVEIQPFALGLGRFHVTSISKYRGHLGVIIDIGDTRPLWLDVLLFSGKHLTIRREFVKPRLDLAIKKGR